MTENQKTIIHDWIKDSKKLVELSERRFYTKPSVKKRLEKKMAKVRERKRLQENQ